MPPADPARLDRILAALPADDAAWLSGQLEPAWRQRARRLAARDAAVLACFAALPDMPPTTAARRIEQALGRYLAGPWLAERKGVQPPPVVGLPAAVRQLARANDGAGLGVRQLLNVRAGGRG